MIFVREKILFVTAKMFSGFEMMFSFALKILCAVKKIF